MSNSGRSWMITKRAIRSLILLGMAASLVAALCVLHTKVYVEHTDARLKQEAYVWQRLWRGPVSDSVAQFSSQIDGFVVLAAQLSWHNGNRQLVLVEVDYAVLSASGRSVGLAFRIGPWPGPFRADDEVASIITGACREIVRRATDAGLRVSELQIDFDCAESKLDGYETWLGAIRSAVAPTRITFTALPAWLKNKGFGKLARAADSFVLQVHSLQAPSPGKPFVLCDPGAANRWVEQAARAGRPFRVALPTYGYLAATDGNGNLIGLSAEGPSVEWPASASLQAVRSDPAAMAGLVRQWSTKHPKLMTGIIWYRLPTSEDRLNWSATTLMEILAGRTPVPLLKAVTTSSEPGVVDIALVNEGLADASLPSLVTVTYSGTKPLADGINGYEALDKGGKSIVLINRGQGDIGVLPPQASLRIGWLRLDNDKEVTIHVMQK